MLWNIRDFSTVGKFPSLLNSKPRDVGATLVTRLYFRTPRARKQHVCHEVNGSCSGTVPMRPDSHPIAICPRTCCATETDKDGLPLPASGRLANPRKRWARRCDDSERWARRCDEWETTQRQRRPHLFDNLRNVPTFLLLLKKVGTSLRC